MSVPPPWPPSPPPLPPYGPPHYGPPHYGPPHYGPPPGYPPYPVRPPTSGWAIAALVFGVLGGVLISVVAGVVALTKTKDGRQGGRGLAIAGLVLSACWVALLLAGVAAYLLIGRGMVLATNVGVGDCLADIPGTGAVATIKTVDCTDPHKGEVYAVLEMPDGDFPGTAAIDAFQEGCAPALAGAAPTALTDPAINVFVLYPSEDSWARGDRAVTCIATTDAARTGSLLR